MDKQDSVLEKISRQIECLEYEISKLMQGIEAEQLTPLQRMTLAIKLMAQHTKFLVFRRQIEIEEQKQHKKGAGTDEQEDLLATWMKQLHGETDEDEDEDE
jgi:hypothetical protein